MKRISKGFFGLVLAGIILLGTGCGDPAEAPLTDPVMIYGQTTFQENCLLCHSPQGTGKGSFPPLAGSEWVMGSKERLIRIMLHGLTGPITVKGEPYRGVMPSWAQLSDREIASTLTYIRRSWGNRADTIRTEEVAQIRAFTERRRQPWTSEELDAAPAVLSAEN